MVSIFLVVVLLVQRAGVFGGAVNWSSSVAWIVWMPMLVFEVGLALWLIIKGVGMRAGGRHEGRRIVMSARVLLASSILQACGAGWHQPKQPMPDPLPRRQQVQVWQEGHPLQWHAVVLTPDSVSGIPYHKPVDCDSCRTSISREIVDSLRLGNPTAGFWKTVGLVIGIPTLAYVVLCGGGLRGEPCLD